MGQLKASDTVMRRELADLFESVRKAVADCVKKDDMIGRQLQKEVETQDYDGKIGQYLKLLTQAHCPLVMAGNYTKLLFIYLHCIFYLLFYLLFIYKTDIFSLFVCLFIYQITSIDYNLLFS
jgi:hypothetical protein